MRFARLFSSGPSPPICQADYQGEFKTKQLCALRSFFKVVGRLGIEVFEPQQLLVSQKQLSVLKIPIALSWYGEASKIEAEIIWQIRFSTFVSLTERCSPPTIKEALTPSTALVQSCLEPRRSTVGWINWRPAYANGQESEELLRLTFPKSEILTPSFWSPFICRRYSIKITIKVTAPGTAKFDLEVPLQVGLERSTPCNAREDTWSDVESDELLPQYSR